MSECNPRSIAIATCTYYPNWYPGEADKDRFPNDKIRGDLALQTIEAAASKGFRLALIDGTSSPDFVKALNNLDAQPDVRITASFSEARCRAYWRAHKTSGVEAICYTEAEKVSIVRDCLPVAAMPVLKGEVDIAIPRRTKASFRTLPKFQEQVEKESNRLWNSKLRRAGLLSAAKQDLDIFFGPKFFRNEPDILRLFLQPYELDTSEIKETELGDIVDPERYSNSLFFPIIMALREDWRVRNVPVPYRHPQTQTEFEEGNPEFDRKRVNQQRSILWETTQFLKHQLS